MACNGTKERLSTGDGCRCVISQCNKGAFEEHWELCITEQCLCMCLLMDINPARIDK